MLLIIEDFETCFKTSVIWNCIFIHISLTTLGSTSDDSLECQTVFVLPLVSVVENCHVKYILYPYSLSLEVARFQTAPTEKKPLLFPPDGALNFSIRLCCRGERGAVVDRSNNFVPSYNQTAFDFVIS